METKGGIDISQLPIGYRFLPTDEELVRHYLRNKVFYRSIPAQIIPDIDASDFYTNPPSSLVANLQGEEEWYLFIHHVHDQNLQHFHGKTKMIRLVGNELGFWESTREEDPVYNSTGDIFAFKLYSTYFSGSIFNPNITKWTMEEFRLSSFDSYTNNLEMEEWVLGRIRRGGD